MKSLDLYFFKFITYFLVVCMSCIFNKPLWVDFVMCCSREHQRNCFLSVSLFLSLSHSFAFFISFPDFYRVNCMLWELLFISRTMGEMVGEGNRNDLHCCAFKLSFVQIWTCKYISMPMIKRMNSCISLKGCIILYALRLHKIQKKN